MFEDFKENLINLLKSRVLILLILLGAVAIIMLQRVFDLQIVHGEEYMNSFETRIKKEVTIEGARGNIYDRNGNLLAYNELAHSVTIEDVYESGLMKNFNLNSTIFDTINIIEHNGDKFQYDFNIDIDRNGNYYYTVSGTALYRFLADVYGHNYIDDLTAREKEATPEDVINYLCGWDKFRIGVYGEKNNRSNFIIGNGYSKTELLKILNVRYDMNNNSYQKYISTTIASDVGERTVAVIMERSNELPGVSISEGTIRKYIDAKYLSNIIGYTGKVSSQDELAELQAVNIDYTINDTVGKLGIEKSMENYLQGTKGFETLFVNSVGKTTEITNYVEPVAGNDIYLTIDKDLQIAVYNILEEHLASILYSKIINAKDFDKSSVANSKIMIPIYDVYCALFDNNVININDMGEDDATDTERIVYERYLSRKEDIIEKLKSELWDVKTPYENLTTEYKVYESFIVDKLYSEGILVKDSIDVNDPVYINWTTEETISANEYINYCISMNWIDLKDIELDAQYSDSSQIFEKIVDYILLKIDSDNNFTKKIFTYMVKNDIISGSTICKLLIDQKVVSVDDSEKNRLYTGTITSYQFMMNRIRNLDVTPAMLALDPCSASCVVTDVNTGDVLALVSYPGFDNNKLANGVDAEYYASLQSDLSTPMINYATRHKTAPGSTFKPVSATAGLCEGVITTSTRFTCTGLFDKIYPPAACWIYGSGSHGSLSVSEAIQHSCNVYFYELGYALGTTDGNYSSEYGLSRLKKYADEYGLTETSGIEIEESVPTFSDTDAVRSAIGQGTNSYTTVGLARYVTTVANSGTCYNLTLLDRITDSQGNILKDNQATVRNTITMNQAYWNAIHEGMRNVVLSRSDYNDMSIAVAGKTGTAEESKTRGNHALFMCYAPYNNPEISVTTRIAYGYTSTYAATTTKDVLNYYFKLEDIDTLITGEAQTLEAVAATTD